jgi:hypothetical protein
MRDIIHELTTSSLERLVAALEARLIGGTASHHDIDTYMRMQMLLAERQLGTADLAIDPRD